MVSWFTDDLLSNELGMFDGHGYYIRGARFAPHAVVDDLI